MGIEEAIYELFEQGYSLSTIAKELDMSKDEVKFVVEERYYIKSRRRRAIASVGEFIELAKTNTADELAARYKVKVTTVYWMLHKYGVKSLRKRNAYKTKPNPKAVAILQDLEHNPELTYDELVAKYKDVQ